MANETGRIIADYLLENLSANPQAFLNKFEPQDLINTVVGYVDRIQQNQFELAEEWLGKPSVVESLRNAGLEARQIRQVVKASAFNVDDLEIRVHQIAQRILNKLLEDQDESGSWNYLSYEKEKPKTSNAWVTATCLYSLWKSRHFLELDRKVIQKAIESGIAWLFRPEVFCKVNGYKGWTATWAHEKKSDTWPMLQDTAYVLNILMRIEPNLDRDYEAILRQMIDPNSSGKLYWYLPDLSDKDIAGMCYGLRLAANYSIRAEKHRFSRYTPELNAMAKNLCAKVSAILAYKQDRTDGHWDSKKGLSKKAMTALAVHSLRSAGRRRDWPGVITGCNWLLKRLEYHDGYWCWTQNDEKNKKVRSIHDSALIISALLRASTFAKFTRAEAVILWLVNEFEEGNLEGSIYLATVLCAFSDYLRAFNEPGFFKFDDS